MQNLKKYIESRVLKIKFIVLYNNKNVYSFRLDDITYINKSYEK